MIRRLRDTAAPSRTDHVDSPAALGNSVNKVILIGNLGRDPEIRSMQDGSRVANLAGRHLGEVVRPGIGEPRGAPNGTAS
jgi:hypothetical protein